MEFIVINNKIKKCKAPVGCKVFKSYEDAKRYIKIEEDGCKNFERLQYLRHIDRMSVFGLKDTPRKASEIYEYYTLFDLMLNNMEHKGTTNQSIYFSDTIDDNTKYDELNGYICNCIKGDLKLPRTSVIGEDNQFVYVWADDDKYEDVFVINKETKKVTAYEVKNLSGDGLSAAGSQIGNWANLYERNFGSGLDYKNEAIIIQLEKDFPKTAIKLKKAMDNWDSRFDAYGNTILLDGEDAINYFITKQRCHALQSIGSCDTSIALVLSASGRDIKYFNLDNNNFNNSARLLYDFVNIKVVVRSNQGYTVVCSQNIHLLEKYTSIFRDMDKVLRGDINKIVLGRDLNYVLSSYNIKDKKSVAYTEDGNKALVLYTSKEEKNGKVYYDGIDIRIGAFRYKHYEKVSEDDINKIVIPLYKVKYGVPTVTGSTYPKHKTQSNYDNIILNSIVTREHCNSINEFNYSHKLEDILLNDNSASMRKIYRYVSMDKLIDSKYDVLVNPSKYSSYKMMADRYLSHNEELSEKDKELIKILDEIKEWNI